MLEANIPGWSIVMTGAWNPRILTPQWIGNGRLTASQMIEIEVAFDEPRAPRRLKYDDVVLEVQSSRVALKATNESDACLQKIQANAIKLLEDLPHTPISGAGINFSFIDNEPSVALLGKFNLADNGNLGDQLWNVTTTTIHRELRHDNEVLNLILALDGAGKVHFDLNYHLTPPDTDAAKAHIQSDIIARKQRSLQLVQEVYYA